MSSTQLWGKNRAGNKAAPSEIKIQDYKSLKRGRQALAGQPSLTSHIHIFAPGLRTLNWRQNGYN